MPDKSSSYPSINAAAIIVAGGTGERMGGDIPKQFLEINGKTILEYSIRRLCDVPNISTLILVVSEPHLKRAQTICSETIPKAIPWEVTVGGASRFHSSHNGMKALQSLLDRIEVNVPDVVLIHDAVRPCIDTMLVSAVIQATIAFGAAVPAIAQAATLKAGRNVRDAGIFVESTVHRSNLYQAQTPQGLKWPMAIELFDRAAVEGIQVTDDVQVAEKYGMEVQIIPGSRNNLKITHPDDLALAEYLLGLK